MPSVLTLQKYISRLDKVIASNDSASAKDLQEEILAVLSPELEGLKRGLTNYGVYMAASIGGKTFESYTPVDFIKDARTLRSRLQVELEKNEEAMQPLNVQQVVDLQHEFVSACAKIADNPASYASFDEDGLNREVRNFIDSAITRFGYTIADQTQQGLSGSKPGELDIRINKNGIPVAIYEGLIHKDRSWLYSHVEKAIGKYNQSGCKAVYVVEFSRNKGFGGFWDTAMENVDEHPKIQNIVEVNTVLNGVKMLKGTFDWEGQQGDFYYIGVNCYVK